MRTLITTSRMPFAVDEIRKLGEAGNEITAVDTFKYSPGSHSKGAARHIEVPAPAQQTEEFIGAISDIIDEHQIEWVLPMFEEVFYLAAHRDRFEGRAQLFFPDFDTLAKVHDKVTFSNLCVELGLPVARMISTTTKDEFKDAIGQFPHWFARAAYGRGGLNIITNSGPLAGEGSVDEIEPSEDDPWLVQEYLEGTDLCSWSVAHEGKIALHSTYEHALEIDHRGGIVFESVTPPETLEAASAIVEHLGWTGQVSFDYLRTEDGTYHMVECNPRPTAGCTLATEDEMNAAIFGEVPAAPLVVPEGRKREIKEAVLRDIFQHLSHWRSDVEAAKGGSDVYGQPHDHLPLLYTVLSLQHVRTYRKSLGLDRSTREDLMAAQFFDVEWDGSPIK